MYFQRNSKESVGITHTVHLKTKLFFKKQPPGNIVLGVVDGRQEF